MLTKRPPVARRPPHRFGKFKGGPPRPPTDWRRGEGGSGGGSWPRWVLYLICAILTLGSMAIIVGVIAGFLQWPIPVGAVIAVTIAHHWRSGDFLVHSEDRDEMNALPWGIAAGVAGFFLSQLSSSSLGLGMLALAAAGIGGAIGVGISLTITLLISTVSLTGLIVAEIRDCP